MQNKTTLLSAYQPPVFEVKTISLDIDLQDDHALVTNCMRLVRQHPGPLRLQGDDLTLIHVHLNEKQLMTDEYEVDGSDLVIKTSMDAFVLTVVTRIYPQKNTALSGLYLSNHLYCTQCEAEGFRRITFFPDRPDVLAIYTTRITADKARYPVLLSNGNRLEAGDAPQGRHWVLWHDPFKKPSYLFALVAGQLVCVDDYFITRSGRRVALQIFVEPGNEDKCAHAMESLKKAMRWDEEQYGREYDLDLFMIVAVSDFNMGAMENKGLNIFNAKYILARPDTATDQDYADIEGVVAHEYFHNWTGNRVTCRDWFQLSLKEGLTVFRDQEFSCDMNSRDVNRIHDVKLLRQIQFPEDAGCMAHPVRPMAYQEINNFYTATIYNKGAEVIRMQETLLGKAGFRRGMDLYFERHDGQAVTINDFVAAMSDANGRDLTQFMQWYNQAGTPVVTLVDEAFKDGRLTLSFTQSCPQTPDGQKKEPFMIPIRIGLFDKKGQPMPIVSPVLVLEALSQSFVIEGLAEKPLVSLLHDFSAPVRLEREASLDEWIRLFRFETNGFLKWDVSQRLSQAVLTACYQGAAWEVDVALLDIYRESLCDETYDEALRAELLTPPGFDVLMGVLAEVDVGRLEDVRDFFRKTLATALWDDAHALYRRLWQAEDHAMHGRAYGRRRLRQVCLRLMMALERPEALALCEQQFVSARTMTDQLGSFGLLVNSSNESVRTSAIERFYHQWQAEDLVMDKWFSLQASSDVPDAIENVNALLLHPAFQMKNPNKVRAVVGAFCQGNPRHFHAADGRGYVFLTERLFELDKINPQIAARLATPFTRWQRLDRGRQTLMLQQLERLSSKKLSRDLSEVVHKSLGK
jgi:aminopeptidase N